MKDNFYPLGLGQYLVAGIDSFTISISVDEREDASGVMIMSHDIPQLIAILKANYPDKIAEGLQKDLL